jgi:hypothetical protein
MEKVKFLIDHPMGNKGQEVELDAQIADTFVKIGVVERSPLPKKLVKENALGNNNIENAAFN